ncbi:VOC family protein [Streptomyces sp. GQFP]|uniref:VOC family protein n=1 Tax=Streptomyces sp. GQFP TaxID=2907545 RepID=UPI003FA6E206
MPHGQGDPASACGCESADRRCRRHDVPPSRALFRRERPTGSRPLLGRFPGLGAGRRRPVRRRRAPAEGDRQAEVARLVSLGATRIDIGQGEVDWVVMADPDGHEFCVRASR